jgi:xylan 1,4-beta-xylosidase
LKRTTLKVSSLALAATVALSRAGEARDYQLTVNAASETGRINRFWQAAVGSDHMYMVINSARTGINLKAPYAMAATELGMKRVRGHGVFDDDVGVYHEVNGQPTYTWDKLDQIFDYITSIGMDPLIEVGFMPKDLASGTKTFGWYGGVPGNVTLPKDWGKWGDFMYNVAKHCVERYGLERVRTWNWEVWNEPDLPRGDFFQGTIQDYFKLYDTTVAGLLRADAQLRVGGPSVAISGNNWISDFIDHCMANRVKLDFITWHTYPNFKADPTAIPGAQRNVQGVLDRKKAQYPQLNIQNYLTEWNATYLGGDSFHHEMAASFVAKTIHGLFANQNGVKAPDSAAFWVISELWEEWQTTADAFDVMGMVLRTHDVRKPSFLAYQMMAAMHDIELDFQGGTKESRGLNGWATVSDNKKQVEILIYDHNFVNATDSSADFVNTVVDNVTLNVKSLPFAKPQVTVQRFGVDRDHNNAYTVAKQGGDPHFPNAATWTKMEQAGQLRTIQPDEARTTTAGALTLQFQQNQPGVSLFLITEEGAVVGPPGSGADAGVADSGPKGPPDAGGSGGGDASAPRPDSSGSTGGTDPGPSPTDDAASSGTSGATSGPVGAGGSGAAGAPGSGGSGLAGASPSAGGGSTADASSGCGCRLNDGTPSSRAGLGLLAVVLAALGRRRARSHLSWVGAKSADRDLPMPRLR